MNQQHYGRLYPALTAIYGIKKGYSTAAIIEGQEFRKTKERLVESRRN